MVSIIITPEELEKFKLIAKAYDDGGREAAKEKMNELNFKNELKVKVETFETAEPKVKVETFATAEPIVGCVPCAVCPVIGNPAFIIAFGFLA